MGPNEGGGRIDKRLCPSGFKKQMEVMWETSLRERYMYRNGIQGVCGRRAGWRKSKEFCFSWATLEVMVSFPYRNISGHLGNYSKGKHGIETPERGQG